MRITVSVSPRRIVGICSAIRAVLMIISAGIQPRTHFRIDFPEDRFPVAIVARILIIPRKQHFIAAAPQQDRRMRFQPVHQCFRLLPAQIQHVCLFTVHVIPKIEVLPQQDSSSVAFLVEFFRQDLTLSPDTKAVKMRRLCKQEQICHPFPMVTAAHRIRLRQVTAPKL